VVNRGKSGDRKSRATVPVLLYGIRYCIIIVENSKMQGTCYPGNAVRHYIAWNKNSTSQAEFHLRNLYELVIKSNFTSLRSNIKVNSTGILMTSLTVANYSLHHLIHIENCDFQLAYNCLDM
jgi:hypothetical protein